MADTKSTELTATDAQLPATNPATPVVNAVKIVGEVGVVPGTSLLLDGKIVPGLAHVVAGLAARAAFGIPGLIAVAANSYAKSVTGRHLHQQLRKD